VETIRKIQRVFGDNAMGITQIKEWYSRFRAGNTSVECDARSGGHSTSRNDELIDQVRTLVMQDRRVSVRELAEELGISTGSVHSILTDDLAMRSVREIRAEAPAHSSQLIQTFLAKHTISVVRQAPDSPYMAPCVFLAVPPPKNAAERDSI
jgi:hypothetical protein